MSDHAYNAPFRAPPAFAPQGAGSAGPVGVSFEGMEVTQAVQDMAHSVPLVAGKATVVRVYLGTTANAPIGVRGVLRVKPRIGGTWVQVTSIRPVQVNPAENGQLRKKRESIDKSLNFILPTSLSNVGSWTIALSQLQQVTQPSQPLPVPDGAMRNVNFVTTPPLRVKVIGVRYTDTTHGPARTFEPAAKDFVLIRSWLGRAYPVASVTWSQMVVNGPNAWPFDAGQNNAFIRALRAQDMASGGDRRTHYFGLVDDGAGQNFMRGLASGVPTTAPDPSTVASGPTGANTWGWDVDGCYGDWYTGHELGHTFGRLHAMFCGATGGGPYPYPNGQLSPNDGSFVGLDFGDAPNGVPMQALPGVVWHDVMTYCERQWLSSFTYTGIRDRIVAENTLTSGPTPASSGGLEMAGPKWIHAVATVNVTKETGTLQFVSPVAASEGPTPGAEPGEAFVLRLKSASGETVGEYPAPFYPDACADPGYDKQGVIDAYIPWNGNAASLELVRGNRVLSQYRAGGRPEAPEGIEAARPAAGLGMAAAEAREVADPIIRWGTGGAGATPSALGVAPAKAMGHKYLVQVSTDEGRSWTTIGVGLSQPEARIDRNLLAGAEHVQVRVTATDGFNAATTTKTFRAEEL